MERPSLDRAQGSERGCGTLLGQGEASEVGYNGNSKATRASYAGVWFPRFACSKSLWLLHGKWLKRSRSRLRGPDGRLP